MHVDGRKFMSLNELGDAVGKISDAALARSAFGFAISRQVDIVSVQAFGQVGSQQVEIIMSGPQAMDLDDGDRIILTRLPVGDGNT